MLLTEQEVAHLLRLKRSTLRAWRVKGKGPRFLKAGGRVLYKSADVEGFLGVQLDAAELEKILALGPAKEVRHEW